MLRKQIIGKAPATPAPMPGEIDLTAVAVVQVTSESPEHPVDHAFDGRRGPGGSRWMAGEPGEQTLILAFDAPQAIRRVILEVEEPEVARTQELQLAVSTDGGRTYREVLRQEYNFSPPGTTFEREDWEVHGRGRDPPATRDQAGQGRQALPGDDHVAGLEVKKSGRRPSATSSLSPCPRPPRPSSAGCR